MEEKTTGDTMNDHEPVTFSRAAWWAFVGMSVGPALSIGIPLLVWGFAMSNRITRMETILEFQKASYTQSVDNTTKLLLLESRVARLEVVKL